MFLFISIFLNILLITIIIYILKRNNINYQEYDKIKQQIVTHQVNTGILEEKNLQKNLECDKYQNHITEISQKKDLLEKKIIEVQANYLNLEKDTLILQQKTEELEQKIAKLNIDYQNIYRLNVHLESDNQSLRKELENKNIEIKDLHKNEIANLHNINQKNFENLANKILEEKSTKFTEINQKNLNQILQPLEKNLDIFKKQVADCYDKESKERFALHEQIKILFDQTNKISDEANNLASALKGGSKQQGSWGEMLLETILQHSGLQKDIHYFKEKSFDNEDGASLRPDFQIHLPDNRLIITDSKVSLVAYNKFCETNDNLESEKLLDEHLKSVKKHIDNLSQKKYDDYDKSLDFIIMFMPIEPAFLLAIQADKSLWSYAYTKRILIVSPTNLIACLKIINDLWKKDNLSKNAKAIVNRAEKLYNKFIISLESITEVGKKLQDAQKSYDQALVQMSEGKGNLIWQAENLRVLGLKSDKKIPIDFEILPDED